VTQSLSDLNTFPLDIVIVMQLLIPFYSDVLFLEVKTLKVKTKETRARSYANGVVYHRFWTYESSLTREWKL
jgi:hypothetical protein